MIGYWVLDRAAGSREITRADARGSVWGEATLWIDVIGMSAHEAANSLASLGLEGLTYQAAACLGSTDTPSDPRWRELLREQYDGELAIELERGEGDVKLVHCVEPDIRRPEIDGRRRMSVSKRYIGILAGNGWIVTLRGHPVDDRFTTDPDDRARERNEVRRALENVGALALSYERGVALVIAVLRSCLTATDRLAQEINNRSVDIHRLLGAAPSSKSAGRTVTEDLFDLRWILDSIAGPLGSLSVQTNARTREFVGAARGRDESLGQTFEALYDSAVARCGFVRSALSDAMTWFATTQTTRLLEAQEEANSRATRTQTLVSFLSAVFLGPGLVAAVFGAFPAWWSHNNQTRAVVAIGLMLVSVVVVFALLRYLIFPHAKSAEAKAPDPGDDPPRGDRDAEALRFWRRDNMPRRHP